MHAVGYRLQTKNKINDLTVAAKRSNIAQLIGLPHKNRSRCVAYIGETFHSKYNALYNIPNKRAGFNVWLYNTSVSQQIYKEKKRGNNIRKIRIALPPLPLPLQCFKSNGCLNLVLPRSQIKYIVYRVEFKHKTCQGKV